MSPDYTEESLQLAITEAVYASNTGSSMNTLLQQLFGADYDNNVSNTLKNYVRRYYINQLKGFIRHFGKKHIYEQLKAGSAAFIQRFEEQATLNNLFNDVTRVQCRINHLLKEESEGSLFIEFSRYFTRLRNHFVPLQIEETFRLTLVEWLQSGEMTKTIRNEINTWFTNGSKLNQFKQMNFATATKRDSYKAKVMKAVQSIKTNEFVQLDHLKNILSKFFAPAEMNINNDKLRLCGRTIFVSDWIAKIVQQREKNSNLDVEIYAVDCCGIDCDINLYGINLVICSNKVYVWNSHLINLSGLTYKPGKSKAKNAENSSENGSDGKHGCPGYSSGNFNLNAKEMINPSLLSVYLNGGRGQDGDDGGDGYNGVNGIGITKEELEKLCVDYSSLYFNWWDTFQKYSPPKNWTVITTKWNKSNQFGYEEYQDENKRKIIYSFAGDVGYFYTTYHLYFMVQGSNGTMSTQGGSNGTGGEGGYRGNAVAENPETGEAFPINIYRNMGENGLNGLVGTSGKIGTNGNDMVLIDVSITGGQKKIIGSSNTKLSTSYDYEATTDNRFNGHRKHIEKQSACFARFATTTIDQTERRAAAAVQNTAFSRASKAVAKKHIIANEVLSYAENFFETENAFLADACKQRATAQQNNENENEENEATENVTEEVVILRQHDETPKVFKYTPDSEKKTRPKVTPEILIEQIKKIGRQGTIGSIAQNIFDLFSIEISIELLNAVALYTLFQKNRFRRNVLENRFALALIAAQQDRLVNGKSFSEIVTFAKDVTNRRQQKYAFAKLNGHLKKFIDEFEDVEYNPNLSIDVGANKIYGMKRVDFTINIDTVRKTTREFFRDFTKYRVQQDLLELFNYFFKRIHDKYALIFEDFNEQIDWTDKKSYEAYFNMLQAWLKENQNRKETETTSSDNKDNEHTKKSLPSLRSKTTLEARFEELITILQNDRKYVNNSLDELHKHIKANKELTGRFGDVPTFEEKKSLKQKITRSSGNQDIYDDIEPTLQIIRFYWLAFRILTYMRHLYNCNELFAIEMKKIEYKGIYTDDGHHIDFENFLERARKQPLDIASEACQLHMQKYRINSAPVRYLTAHKHNINYQSYVQTGYYELSKIENFNSTSKQISLLWIVNYRAYTIDVDKNYRDLIETQTHMTKQYSIDLQTELDCQTKYNYQEFNARQEFLLFYDKSFHSSILQWIEGYYSLTNDHLLLQHLHHRFYIDGCHLTPFELQFILLSSAKMQIKYRCHIHFLLLLCNSTCQNELVNIILYMLIIYYQARRVFNMRIYNGIQLIENTRYKALFAIKLDEYNNEIDFEQIYKLILMLQHTSDGSEQLEKMSLQEWIDIANKQKWSEIGSLIKQYGGVGYYLGFLDDHGRKNEEEMMRHVFNTAKYIPETLIAKISQFIVNNEVCGNQDYFNKLKLLLESGNDFSNLQITSNKRLYLITQEFEQQKFIKYISKKCPHIYETLLPSDEREIDDMINLVTGLHDVTPETKLARQNEIKKIGDMVKKLQTANKNDKTLSESMRLLLEYDEYLYELREIRLRPTQQMAVLYAVESTKNVLEQVNTGEGKSYIIAAIAIIRRKTNYKHVDIITSSPVLAQRDAEDMSNIYTKFHLTVGHNCDEDIEKRKRAYESDIVYGDIARFQRDYLLHTFYKKNILGDRTRDAVIVDEVDNMLLDNGNNMLYLSHNVVGLNLLESLLIFIHKLIYLPIFNGVKTDLQVIQAKFDDSNIKQAVLIDVFGRITFDDLLKLKTHNMTEKNVEEQFKKLIENQLIDADGYLNIHSIDQLSILDKLSLNDNPFFLRLKNIFQIILNRQREIDLPKYLREFVKLHLDEFIRNSKNALFMKNDHDYVVDIDHTRTMSSTEPRITIIDSNTGADLATSQWSEGLHQFLQIKHGCRLTPISLKAVFISNVAYLKDYQKINGLSGTLGSEHESQTLIDLYKADLVKIPTFQPKFFYEHVPIIDIDEDTWLQNLYDEVCDQACAKRSVLIICESIAQVRLVHEGFKFRYQQERQATNELRTCFENITIYEREFNEFNFKVGSELKCSRLIIATNLAGRGTDIKLSKELINAGGLHVITAFLPVNCRIEEQAFGRAARCGQPGSAQIIAMNMTDNGIQPSVFQLKMFRDNQEVHRLASLKSFYDFHTETEEKCLEKFRHHCSQALSIIYSSKNMNTLDDLPTPAQLVYFALLDKWALWLDKNAPLINNCAKNHSENDKQNIIKSVDDFLKAHPITGDNQCYEIAKEWVDIPQTLITIGIIQMSHDNGFEQAENTFNRIPSDRYEFSAEIYYYKACMRLCDWISTRKTLNSIKIVSNNGFPQNIEYAIEYFQKSRTLFNIRIQRQQREAKIVAQFLDSSGPNFIKTCGFAEQRKAIIRTYELIIANIDWMLGIPCQPDMFVTKDVPADYATTVYDSLVRQGLISPISISEYAHEDWQLVSLRDKFKLSKIGIQELINGVKTDPRSQTFNTNTELDVNIMYAYAKLAYRIGFWMQLKNLHVFIHPKKTENKEQDIDLEERIKHVLLVNKDHANQLPVWMNQLKPIPYPDSETLKYQIRLSNETEHGQMYDYKDVIALADEQKLNEVVGLIKSKVLSIDWIGEINCHVLHKIGYFDTFDGITTTDITDFFQIDPISAAWIIDILLEHDILKRETIEVYQFTKDNQLWEDQVEIHMNKPIPDNATMVIKYAEYLNTLRNHVTLKNVTIAIIGHACKISKSDEQIAFHKSLVEAKLLEKVYFTKFRLYGKLDCSSLPSAIANEIEEFLMDRFAYSFALEHLCLALDDSHDNPTTPKQLFLPDNPHDEFYNELLSTGITIQSRISQEDYQNIEFDQYQYQDEIFKVINDHRTKLYDKTHYHMEFVSFASYYTAQNYEIDSETKTIIENGLPMVISKRSESIGFWLQNNIIKAVSAASKAIWSGVEAVGNFFYSIGSTISQYISPFIDMCVDAFDYAVESGVSAYRTIKENVVSVVNTIAESEIVKMATEKVKIGASYVGQAVVSTAEVVGNVLVTTANVTGLTTAAVAVGNTVVAVGNAVGSTAVKVGSAVSKAVVSTGQYIADTRVFKAGKEVFSTAMNFAKNVYQSMSTYVTASIESYLYYQQCRIAASRIARNNGSNMDEHFIIRTYDRALSMEKRLRINDETFEQAMQNYIRKMAESWSSQFEPIIKLIINEHFSSNRQLYNIADVQTFVESCEPIRKLSNDINEQLVVMANATKIVFFQLIKHCAVEKNINLATISFDELGLSQIKPNFNQIMESLKITCKEIKENIQGLRENVAPHNSLVNSLSPILNEKFKLLINSVFADPTIKLTTAFLESCRKHSKLATMSTFQNVDADLKKAISQFNVTTHHMKNAEFLLDQLRQTVTNAIKSNPNNKNLLRFAVKLGCPMPLAAISHIANAAHLILIDTKYGAGFWVYVYDKDADFETNEPILKYSTAEATAKLEMKLRCINDQFFICRADAVRYRDIELINNCFFYESFIDKMKHRAKYFSKHELSFREFLIEKL